ncbi:hypothetical protein ACO1O0_000609 [Amphichorda felina]
MAAGHPTPTAGEPLPKLSSLITYSLVLPSLDPETGLNIFPRLPEIDEEENGAGDTSSSSESAFTSNPTAPIEQTTTGHSNSNNSNNSNRRKHSFSGRLTGSIWSLFSSSPPSTYPPATPPSSAEPSAEPSSPPRQPMRRRNTLSGGHVYCRHTWDGKCKCLAILALDGGDYCAACWEGRCLGTSALGAKGSGKGGT